MEMQTHTNKQTGLQEKMGNLAVCVHHIYSLFSFYPVLKCFIEILFVLQDFFLGFNSAMCTVYLETC